MRSDQGGNWQMGRGLRTQLRLWLLALKIFFLNKFI